MRFDPFSIDHVLGSYVTTSTVACVVEGAVGSFKLSWKENKKRTNQHQLYYSLEMRTTKNDETELLSGVDFQSGVEITNEILAVFVKSRSSMCYHRMRNAFKWTGFSSGLSTSSLTWFSSDADPRILHLWFEYIGLLGHRVFLWARGCPVSPHPPAKWNGCVRFHLSFLFFGAVCEGHSRNENVWIIISKSW